jgi:hypothetical protein
VFANSEIKYHQSGVKMLAFGHTKNNEFKSSMGFSPFKKKTILTLSLSLVLSFYSLYSAMRLFLLYSFTFMLYFPISPNIFIYKKFVHWSTTLHCSYLSHSLTLSRIACFVALLILRLLHRFTNNFFLSSFPSHHIISKL